MMVFATPFTQKPIFIIFIMVSSSSVFSSCWRSGSISRSSYQDPLDSGRSSIVQERADHLKEATWQNCKVTPHTGCISADMISEQSRSQSWKPEFPVWSHSSEKLSGQPYLEKSLGAISSVQDFKTCWYIWIKYLFDFLWSSNIWPNVKILKLAFFQNFVPPTQCRCLVPPANLYNEHCTHREGEDIT